MSSPLNLLEQGDVLGALVRTVLAGNFPALKDGTPLLIPGPEHQAVVQPRTNSLVDDYIRTVRGSVSGYKGVVPFHMFPQWTFPISGKTLEPVPWNLTSVMNAGFSVEINGPIPRAEKLHLSARLEDGDITDSRALMTTRITTGTANVPELLVSRITTIVKLPKNKNRLRGQSPIQSGLKPPSSASLPKAIPTNAREIGRIKVGPGAGWDYAMVSGDINPLHWSATYARAFGQKSQILHGFASGAMAIELLNKKVFMGRTDLLTRLEMRFTKPIRLPGSFGVFVDDQGGLFAGSAPGGDASISARFENKEMPQ